MSRINVFPGLITMSDVPLKIVVENVTPGCCMTLKATLKYDSHTFTSHSTYKADSNGVVDLDSFNQKPIAGSYTGSHPMGLLAHLKPPPESRKGTRFFPRTVLDPLKIKLEVFAADKLDANSIACASTTLTRMMLSPNVKRVEVSPGRVRGTMFIPEGTGPYPGVIDMFGTAGGLREDRAALLASHGFLTLALAYFDYKDLQKDLQVPLEMEYFLEAADYLSSHPKVTSGGVGVMGVSLGADLANLMACFSDKIKACVPINGYHMIDGFTTINFKGERLKYVEFEHDPAKFKFVDGSLVYLFTRDAQETAKECILPIHLSPIKVKFLFLASTDDQSTCSLKSARILKRSLEEHGLGGNAQIMALQGAGHLLEPPYSPLCTLTYHKHIGLYFVYGGQVDEHCSAQEEAWLKTIEFFKEALNVKGRSKL